MEPMLEAGHDSQKEPAMRFNSRCVLGMAALGSLAGCGALADSQYQGEPLMQIEGSIVSAASSLPEMEVALLWDVDQITLGCDHITDSVARVATEGSFPAAFRLVITQPPPAIAFSPSFPFAKADIVALDKENRIRGYATTPGKVVYKVLYAQQDIPPTSDGSGWLGGTGLKAGYQMGTWTIPSDSPNAFFALAKEGENVQIEVAEDKIGAVVPACNPPIAPPTTTPPTTAPPRTQN
jgi:hypothetical protein